jgi:CheY-like chemotaxis protein
VKILLVEDDEYKRDQITEHLHSLRPDAFLVQARSAQSAVRALLNQPFDLVVLDMSLPTFDVTLEEYGGRPQPLGGKEVLIEMERRDRQIPVIVVTQFTQFERLGMPAGELDIEQLDRDLKVDHAEYYWGAIFYDTLGTWRARLEEAICEICLAGGEE